MKIRQITVSRAQRGFVIEAVLSVPTRRQSTNEDVQFRRDYKGNWMLPAILRFRRDAKRHARELQKALGAHDLKPSNFMRGLLWT